MNLCRNIEEFGECKNNDLLKEINNLREFNTKLIDTNSNLNNYLIEDISKKRKLDDCTNSIVLRKSPRFSNK